MSRPVIFGEVLFDRFPDGSEVLGGAPFNVAWNLRGLGLDPLLVSRVGRDELGKRILQAMESFGLDRSGIQIDDHYPTGTVDVALVDGEPHFEIVADRAWDHIASLSLPIEPALIYHGSLALRSPRSRAAAEALLDGSPAPVFFDVNLRTPWWDASTILDRLGSVRAVKLNEGELRKLASAGASTAEKARGLLSGTGADTVYVTRGSQGAEAYSAGGIRESTRPGGDIRVVDTVGAGDAFSAVLILGILEAWPLGFALDRAREFAEAVVGLRGATTTEPAFYSRLRTTWSPA
jgi:fructokinase